jgi:hypothetical protein
VALRLFADQPVNILNVPSFRAEHFPYSGPYPWLDRPDAAAKIEERLATSQITEAQAQQCRNWERDGYLVLPRLFDPETIDAVWNSYEKAIASGKITLPPEPISTDDPYPGRYLNPHSKCGAFCRILKHPGLLAWLQLLMERTPKPLQTIASHKGSQQAAHSDSIHMTTYPLGYLTAAWVAMEDIDPDSGPLVYYPGSHKLPYIFSKDVDISEADFKSHGYTEYQKKYEPFIQQELIENQIAPHYFHAQKGDVLIWHANLIHGGSPRKNIHLSRKAVVCHFFVKGSFAYHDLAASWSKRQYFGTCLLR